MIWTNWQCVTLMWHCLDASCCVASEHEHVQDEERASPSLFQIKVPARTLGLCVSFLLYSASLSEGLVRCEATVRKGHEALSKGKESLVSRALIVQGSGLTAALAFKTEVPWSSNRKYLGTLLAARPLRQTGGFVIVGHLPPRLRVWG